MHHPCYGELEKQDGNIFTYKNKKVIIEVNVKEEGIYHILKIMSRDTRDTITVIEDLKNGEDRRNGEGFIRYFEEGKYYVEYNNNSEIINIEHEVKVDFIKHKDRVNDKDETIKRAKAVKSSSLTYESYEKMYNKEVVKAMKTSANRNYGEGYVSINTNTVNLNPTNYGPPPLRGGVPRKRLRIIKNGKWVDTAICRRSK
jgi:hypothetical protein